MTLYCIVGLVKQLLKFIARTKNLQQTFVLYVGLERYVALKMMRRRNNIMTGDRYCPECGELTLFEVGTNWECKNENCLAKYTKKDMDELCSVDEVNEEEPYSCEFWDSFDLLED
jgi:hypothetical protein